MANKSNHQAIENVSSLLYDLRTSKSTTRKLNVNVAFLAFCYLCCFYSVFKATLSTSSVIFIKYFLLILRGINFIEFYGFTQFVGCILDNLQDWNRNMPIQQNVQF